MTTPDDYSGEQHDASGPGTPAATQGKCPSVANARRAGQAQLRFGLLEGRVVVPADFDAPLPDDVQSSFEGP